MPRELNERGLSAWVEVDGKKLTCYGTKKSTQNGETEISCWIASQENKNFAVQVNSPRVASEYEARLTLDGHTVSRHLLWRKRRSHRFYRKIVEGYRRPFTFSPQVVADDDTLLDGIESSVSSGIGEITIRIKRVINIHRKHHRVPKDNNVVLPAIQTIHETRVKASKPPHQISLGEPTTEATLKLSNHSYDQKETVATFIFKYSPLETLIERGIAPASSKPLPAPVKVVSKPQKTQRRMQRTSPPPVASSSRLQNPGAVPGPSIHRSAAKARDVGDALPASSSRAAARNSITTMASDSDIKPFVGHVKVDPEEIQILEDEEAGLLARLESVRKRKREAMGDAEGGSPRKIVKRESSIPRGIFKPGEVIDLT